MDPSDLASIGLAAVALLVALVALVMALVQRRRYAVMLRRFQVLWGDGAADVATVLARQSRRVDGESARTDEVERAVAELRDGLAQTLQHVAVVRYDAFGDMGGQMSFSAAVVDDRGDGMVISSIHARGESRTYAKGVVKGGSEITLSPEERHALDAARSGRAD
ncbi:DUF4446 family protein [Ornithinimicrobium sediminis]|uniref:DUF4446 family protein n=1 Tax=Ornithinimicrobium sediminis TaxID=2904603 RepID=UPI001E29B531|nr:DUF4446 family protein [Ornithinimicrobium sediminis]